MNANLTSERFSRARDLARGLDGLPAVEDALRDMCVVLDAYGRIVAVGTPMRHLLEFAGESLVGRRFVHRLSRRTRAALGSALMCLRTDGRFPDVDVELWTKSRRLHPAALRARAICSAGAQLVVIEVQLQSDSQVAIDD